MITRKTIQLFTWAFLLMPFAVMGENPGTPKKKKATESAVVTYFTENIAQDSIQTFACSQSIKAGQIRQMQDKVWQWWKKANQQLKEEKLIPLKPLTEGGKGLWKLPAEKEPNAQIPYYWGSKGIRPEAGYPLFLYLHGSGPKDDEWYTGWKLAEMFEDGPSVYFIPQIPNEGGYYRWWQKAKIYAWERLFRQALLTDSINPNRLYCFGISEGGYGSQRLASYYADYLAAAGPMAGGEPLINAPVENCMNIGYSMLTGAQDYGFYRHILTQNTKEAFDSLEQKYPGHYRHRIALIPGRGHGIDYRPTTPWLKDFVRTPQPKSFIWENFEMDGIYRKGFYNLVVLERSNTKEGERTVYVMDIQGNRINLEVNNVSYEVTEKDPQWGIGLKYKKTYEPAHSGKFLLYLSPDLVNLDQEVTVYVNGEKAYEGKPQLRMEHLINSCMVFTDPQRLFPAAVTIDLEKI